MSDYRLALHYITYMKHYIVTAVRHSLIDTQPENNVSSNFVCFAEEKNVW